MCTTMLKDETEAARKMSALETQKCVDRLMEYERELAAPFTKNQLEELFKPKEQKSPKSIFGKSLSLYLCDEQPEKPMPIFSLDKETCRSLEETQQIYHDFSKFLWEQNYQNVCLTREELAYLFKRNPWGQAHGWRDYMILTDAEKMVVDALGLTPEKKTIEEISDRVKAREDLKRSAGLSKSGGRIIQIAGIHVDRNFNVLQYGDIFFVGFGNIFVGDVYPDDLKQMKEEIGIPLEEKFAMLLLNMLKSEHFALEKNKLHPDQIVYLESESRKTMEKSKSANLSLSEVSSQKELHKLEMAEELWSRYQLMTEEEKSILAELNLTPVQPPERKHRPAFSTFRPSFMRMFPFFDRTDAEGSPMYTEKARLRIKMDFVKKPDFPEYSLSPSDSWDNTGHIYVWQDNCNGCESEQNEFYYVRYQLPKQSDDTTEHTHPELVVEKMKLRPDQVEYMKRKCQETIEASKCNEKQNDEVISERESSSEEE